MAIHHPLSSPSQYLLQLRMTLLWWLANELIANFHGDCLLRNFTTKMNNIELVQALSMGFLCLIYNAVLSSAAVLKINIEIGKCLQSSLQPQYKQL